MHKLLALGSVLLMFAGPACGEDECADRIVTNSPPFACLAQLGLEATVPEEANSCDGALRLVGYNDCQEALLFAGSVCPSSISGSPCSFAAREVIEIEVPVGFGTFDGNRRTVEFSIDRGNESGIYRFVVE